MDSVRGILKMRDDLDNEEVDNVFDEFEDAVADGQDPEEAIEELMGLEPDYLMEDQEVWKRVLRGFDRRQQKEQA